MSFARHVIAGLRVLFDRRAHDADLDAELRHWMDLAIRERMERGRTRAQAEREVKAEIGSMSTAREHARSGGWEMVVETLVRDVRYAARNLRASPGYSLAAISTLGIAIAVTTSLLTVSNTVLRQQWLVPDPSRVFTILTARGAPRISPAETRYMNERSKAFSGIIAARCLSGMYDECELSVNDARTNVDFVSGNYFAVVGLPLALGRGFSTGEDRVADPQAVAVISDAMWRSRFGADPGIVGTSVRVDDVRFKVIGVTSPRFTGTRTERKDVWLPLASMLVLRPQRSDIRMQLVNPSSDVSDAVVAGRLAAGATVGEALAELRVLDRAYRQDNRLDQLGIKLIPTTYFPNPSKLTTAAALLSSMFLAVVLVLMLACANVGNLLLARAAARGREIAVRLALGASRRRVVVQLLTESLLLSVAAGVLGVSASFVLPSAIMTRAFGSVSWHFAPDGAVIVAATGLVVLTCIAFGLAPSLHATSADVAAVLKTGDTGSGSSTARRLRGSLLAVQVAVSLLLLVNAGFLVSGIRHAHDSNPGYTTRGIATMTVEFPGTFDATQREGFVKQFMHDAKGLPSVAVAFASAAPLGPPHGAHFRLPGEPETKARGAEAFDVSPGFFELLGLPIVEGRDFTPTDGDDAVLVNQSLASALWPGESPLGRTILDGVERRVVGVVKDASMYRLGVVQGALFRPVAAHSLPTVLAKPSAPSVTQALAAIATRIDARATVHVDSIVGNVDRQLSGLQTVAFIAGALGFIALVLASVGVFGVFAYVVQQRTREIGVRTALGASQASVMALVVRDSSRAVLVGLGAGLVLSIAASRIIASELYGASAFDWRILASLAALLGLAGIAATYVPVRRAARVDPMVALRTD